MSRPPVYRRTGSPRALAKSGVGQQRYFGDSFAELVNITEQLARDEHGTEIPTKVRSLARTLVEIPALFAHILGEHQSLYAAEAFLPTASSPRSLFRHARRLSYKPDPGVAAKGLAAFVVKEGLSGTVDKGLALASSPRGELKSQTYETLDDVHVDAEWNKMQVADANIATPIVFDGHDIIDLPLSERHDLELGEVALLEGQGKFAVVTVVDSLEDAEEPMVRLRRMTNSDVATGSWPAYSSVSPYRLLVQPRLETRIFGWDADSRTYPLAEVSNPMAYTPPATTDLSPSTGYEILPAPSTAGSELYLESAIDLPDNGSYLALMQGMDATPYALSSSTERSVLFKRGVRVSTPTVTGNSIDGFVISTATTELVESSAGGRTTGMVLTDLVTGSEEDWEEYPLDVTVLGDWGKVLGVAPTQPNPQAMTSEVCFSTDLSLMRPGRRVILESTTTELAASAMITKILEPTATESRWRMTLQMEEGAVIGDFAKGMTNILANVASVSHGESRTEAIGSSDGASPYQVFDIKKSPVTNINGAIGAEIELEVRVNGVLWELKEDFYGVDSDARVLRYERDADQQVSIHCGGEGKAAIPPAGKRNIEASYRVGLGVIGDAETGRVSRIKKASPILDSVRNPLSVSGGTDPAVAEDVRRQAVQPIVTFDRAVSVQDHADLALLFDGVARSSARWISGGGVELVAADAQGEAIADTEALRGFLEARRDNSTPLILRLPQPVDVTCHFRVERVATWLEDSVRLITQDALFGELEFAPGLFTFAAREFSQPQSLSGVYSHLLDLEAVAAVQAEVFDHTGVVDVKDIIHAASFQWLRLLSQNCEIEVVDPGSLLVVALEEGGS
ncbi:MAG: hypothetical protein GY927_19370 [bacterium]|nr:hypothetical protein [bacterium]